MSIKRKLTKSEIKNILKNISGISNKNTESQCRTNNIIRKGLTSQLEEIEIYPELIPQLSEEIEKQHRQTLAPAGECVGVLTAQSIGERQTQLTLNTFHSAGLAVSTVLTGVPRFSQLVNATKEPKSVVCQVYFKKNNSSISQLRKSIGHSISQITIKDLYLSTSISLDKKTEPWYKMFKMIYSDRFTEYKCCITYKLDPNKLFEKYITLKDIAQKIEEEYDDLVCVFSGMDECQLDIFVDVSSINLNEEISYLNLENKERIYMEEVVMINLNNLILFGIPKINNFFFKKDDRNKDTKKEKWMIETDGSNFRKLLSHPLIDYKNIISNNMWDIYETLGIEAAREFLIEEFMYVVSSDGTYINDRHIKLLVDTMTIAGTIWPISRYGMKREQTGPLAKASFEECLDNLLKAGANNEIETTQGVSASIICGKRSKIGTGMFGVRDNIDAIENQKGDGDMLDDYVYEREDEDDDDDEYNNEEDEEDEEDEEEDEDDDDKILYKSFGKLDI